MLNFRLHSLSALTILAAAIVFQGACTTPVGVTREDPRQVHRHLTSNVLTTGELSTPTMITLQRHDLDDELTSNPDRMLVDLQAIAVENPESDVFFALAEASFYRAERTGRRARYRAAAVYAYAFLFPEDESLTPSPYDPRFRSACDLYNRGITAGFSSDDGTLVELESALYELPFGWLRVEFDPSQREWADRRLAHFVPVADLRVRGLRNHYRHPGIGAPLAAEANLDPSDHDPSGFVPERIKIPANAFLRIDRPRQQITSRSERIEATLELRAGMDARTILIGTRHVPLELETTSTLASMLADSSVWDLELRGFLQGDLSSESTQLIGLFPYMPGRIPVVLVHGTASSVARWANLLNDLENDADIRKNFQFWFFGYDTGNPVAYSASLLRQSLREAVERFDPDGRDPALRRMVLIGHSQGGLLAKMTAVDSGDRFWRRVSDVPFDELELGDETRAILEPALFVEPLPFVRRVIFIATPHHGSFRAGSRIAHWVAGFAKLPGQLVQAGVEVVQDNPDAFDVRGVTRVGNSIDNMTPGNAFVEVLSDLEIAPEISTHSIIAVNGDGPPEKGNDGIVTYRSAHIDGVESELVVRSSHSVQDHPDAIEEVRRILRIHAALD